MTAIRISHGQDPVDGAPIVTTETVDDITSRPGTMDDAAVLAEAAGLTTRRETPDRVTTWTA